MGCIGQLKKRPVRQVCIFVHVRLESRSSVMRKIDPDGIDAFPSDKNPGPAVSMVESLVDIVRIL